MLVQMFVGLLIALVLIFLLRQGRRGTWVDPADPLFVEATHRARGSWKLLRELHRDHPDEIGVKFAFKTDTGQVEHVWGPLLDITSVEFTTSIESIPRAHRGSLPAKLTMPVAQLEDWHLTLPDGSIRGSFTTQAEIEIRRRRGLPIPSRIKKLSGRFVDS